jgi:hypothetical protein
MADRREDILVRILAIAEATGDYTLVARNKANIPEEQRPACIILDADETADDSDQGRGRPSATVNLIGMSPEIYILLGDLPENVGSEINALRIKLVKAILTDTTLDSIMGRNGGVRYEGCATGLASGRTIEGEMGLSFTFTYVLKPSEL